MLYSFKGKTPKLGKGVYLAPGAHVVGQVTLGDEVSVWFNTVIRADVDTITVGEGTNIQDGTVVHCDAGFPTQIGKNVTIGHSCVIHGCEIGDDCLIGMGSAILNGAKLGPGCVVGAGSLITEGKEFPAGSVIMGRPAKVVRPTEQRDEERIAAGAAHYRRNARAFAQELDSIS